MEHPINILERYWNFTKFRPQQEAIINAVIDKQDAFVLLPTGGGKSLCFQVPALAKEGICIVISPLLALMKDQVKQLNDKGIKALAITGGISYNQLDTLLDNCIYGNYKFLYLSPERLQQELVQERIRQMPVNLIAVDEAHCISQWGHDFRPAYKNIPILRNLHPTVNVVALTASAKPEVVEAIISELDFIKPKIFKQSFFRENLSYMVFNETDKLHKLERILKKYKDSSIVYVRNRKSTHDISAFLESKNISATFYHGGLTSDEKDTNMTDWLQNKKQTMVATNAFGMGIDKPDVKTVIHLNIPESMESYFQEAGRAGRNGNKAFAVILKNATDTEAVKNQFLQVLSTVAFTKIVYRKLSSYFQIPYREGNNQTFDFDFSAFCKAYNFNTMRCYNALIHLDRNSIISLSKQFKDQVKAQFIVSSPALFHYLETHQNNTLLVKSILRMYGGIFDLMVKIDIRRITEKTALSSGNILRVLKQLETDGIICLSLAKTDAQVTFIEPREDDNTVHRIAKVIEQQNKLKHQQVRAMLDYVENDHDCKNMQLLRYFGEKEVKPCQICSVCVNKNTKNSPIDKKDLKIKIIQLLEHRDYTSRDLSTNIGCKDMDLKQVLKDLLEDNIINISSKNTYKLSHL